MGCAQAADVRSGVASASCSAASASITVVSMRSVSNVAWWHTHAGGCTQRPPAWCPHGPATVSASGSHWHSTLVGSARRHRIHQRHHIETALTMSCGLWRVHHKGFIRTVQPIARAAKLRYVAAEPKRTPAKPPCIGGERQCRSAHQPMGAGSRTQRATGAAARGPGPAECSTRIAGARQWVIQYHARGGRQPDHPSCSGGASAGGYGMCGPHTYRYRGSGGDSTARTTQQSQWRTLRLR
jgi:hypothetical protein